jgi:hypothetical protein
MFMDSMKTAKRPEALIQLDKIAKGAVIGYNTDATYPVGKAPLTPAVPCCTQNFEGKRRCVPDPAQFSAPIWRALDFTLDAPHYFQYTYESADGQSFIATATGDLDCDGTFVTWTLKGTTLGGVPRTEIVEPPPNAD